MAESKVAVVQMVRNNDSAKQKKKQVHLPSQLNHCSSPVLLMHWRNDMW